VQTLTADKTNPIARKIAETLDRLITETELNESVSFASLVKEAGLNPARDFVGASLADVDFRDEDLRGFDFSGADLTGADFRRANLAGVLFVGAILTGAIGLPKGEPAQEELLREVLKVQRGRPSGLRLSEAQASLVKGMLLRGDRQHDIAGWFGVNPGRIAEVKDGHLHPGVAPAPPSQLPPQVPPGPVAFQALFALIQARRALEKPGGDEEAKQIIDTALGADSAGAAKQLVEAALGEWGPRIFESMVPRGNEEEQ
jgi:hypothetical protein